MSRLTLLVFTVVFAVSLNSAAGGVMSGGVKSLGFSKHYLPSNATASGRTIGTYTASKSEIISLDGTLTGFAFGGGPSFLGGDIFVNGVSVDRFFGTVGTSTSSLGFSSALALNGGDVVEVRTNSPNVQLFGNGLSGFNIVSSSQISGTESLGFSKHYLPSNATASGRTIGTYTASKSEIISLDGTLTGFAFGGGPSFLGGDIFVNGVSVDRFFGTVGTSTSSLGFSSALALNGGDVVEVRTNSPNVQLFGNGLSGFNIVSSSQISGTESLGFSKHYLPSNATASGRTIGTYTASKSEIISLDGTLTGFAFGGGPSFLGGDIFVNGVSVDRFFGTVGTSTSSLGFSSALALNGGDVVEVRTNSPNVQLFGNGLSGFNIVSSVTYAASSSVVPEPASATLWVTAMLLGAGFRTRKR